MNLHIYKLIVFCDSLFKNRKRKGISFLDYQIQKAAFNFFVCPICERTAAKELYFIPEKFRSYKSDEVDLIQLNYTPSPRGAHSIHFNIVLDNAVVFEDLGTNPKRWGGFSKNIYIPVDSLYVKNVEILAINKNFDDGHLKSYIGTIFAGASGDWNVYIDRDIKIINVETTPLYHKKCIMEKVIDKGKVDDSFRKTFDSIDGLRFDDKKYITWYDRVYVYDFTNNVIKIASDDEVKSINLSFEDLYEK